MFYNFIEINIPVVLLVLEGGVNTLRTATSAIQNGTPVVVIQGSGRAADFIAKGYDMTKTKVRDEQDNE
jgi:transient receptor potential cation channel subfamily M protein 2